MTVTVVTLEKMREHYGAGVHMYCPFCNSKYSANPSDYFNTSEDHVFECCEGPVVLILENLSHKVLQ